jgi:hypothetical protein
MATKDWRIDGDFYVNDKTGWVIGTTQRQDRDGKNAFLYGATIYNNKSLGTARNKKVLFKEIRSERLLTKKIKAYMRSH